MSDFAIALNVTRYRQGGAVDTNPTPAQKAAGNFQKRHITFHGIPISIENPKGSIRRGVGDDGEPWAHKMSQPYGYVRGTTDHDGDPTDIFVGPHKTSDKVFVIDQLHHQTGEFDEHKTFIGFNSKKEALTAYRQSYGKKYGGDHTIGGIAEMNVATFKQWLKRGGGKYPVGHQRHPVSHAPPFAGAFVLPKDAIKALGGGNIKLGYGAADEMFGHHMSFGRGVVHPEIVAYLGDGDLATGHRVLKKFVAMTRQNARYVEGSATKLSKVQVNYRHGLPDKKCALCTMYRPKNTCTAVAGYINAKALCDLFERR